MTQDEIIVWAKEFGLQVKPPSWGYSDTYTIGNIYVEHFVAFAKLVAEKEREACAKILDANAMACNTPIMRSLLQANATAIRSRGQA